MKRASAIIFLGILILGAAAHSQPAPEPVTQPKASPGFQKRHIVIATKRLFDGRGHVLPETRIVVEESKIVAVDPKASPIDYDLRDLTVMPGWIDSHVHITWSFGPDGRNEGADATTQFAA